MFKKTHPISALILAYFYPTPKDASTGIFLHEQAKQLRDQGVQITVIAPAPWTPKILRYHPKWRRYAQTPAYAQIDGLSIYYPRYFRPPGAWFRALSGLSMYHSIKPLAQTLHHREKFNLVNSHALFPAGHAGLLLGQQFDLPTVCVMHGSDIFVHANESKYTRRVGAQIITQTDQVITVSQALKQSVEALAKPKRPVQVVYNGVDIQRFRPLDNPKQARQRLGLPPDIPLILFIGRDVKLKGLPRILAVQDLIREAHPDSKLVVVGADMNQINQLDANLVNQAASWLHAVGVRPPEEIPDWMNACELLVLPSQSEGLGCVLLEAAACKRPAIGASVQGIKEAIQHGVTGLLVDTDKPDQLAAAVIELLNNPEKRAQMGEAGYQRVVSQFQWRHNAQQTIELYHNLLFTDNVTNKGF